jgi:glycosyltransferase involved in cell wall biosynthesis
MKIIHIITSLGDGGAEHTLYKICKYDNTNKHIVISLKSSGKYFSLLQKIGIKVYCLDIGFFSIHKFFSLIKLIYYLKPDIVQTWLVHADFIGGIAARLAGIKKIIWNVRYSNFELGKTKINTILIVKILVKLSFIIPKFIVIVSKKAKKFYEIEGYDKNKLIFIPNGYDLSILKINKTQKIDFKKKIKIKKFLPLIGNVARYNPKKDHLNLIRALSIIKERNINFFCVLVGSNINENNTILISEIRRLKLSANIKLLDQTDDILKVMNGLDIYIQSSSYGEGFPNVVAEAMSCGTPCIVTDVGDASYILGKTGWVVPPKNPKRLADAIKKALDEVGSKSWKIRCNKARLRIKTNFDIKLMLKSYNKLWNIAYSKN